MALIQDAMQQGQPEQPPVSAGQAAPQGQQVDPKLVQMYQRMGLAMMKTIYDKKMTPQILGMVSGAEDPVSGVVQAAMTVVQGISEKVKGSPPQAAFAILPAAVALIFELADAAKILKYDPSMMQQAQAMVQQKMGGEAQGAPAEQPAAQPAAQPQPEQVEA